MALERYYTLFHVLKGFNDYFTPESTLFLDYCLWFLERDFNTLKTCYCKRPERLETPKLNLWEISHVINVVMPSTRPDIKIDATHKKAASILLFTTTKNQVLS